MQDKLRIFPEDLLLVIFGAIELGREECDPAVVEVTVLQQ